MHHDRMTEVLFQRLGLIDGVALARPGLPPTPRRPPGVPARRPRVMSCRLTYFSDDDTNCDFVGRLAWPRGITVDPEPALHALAGRRLTTAAGCDGVVIDLDHLLLGLREQIISELIGTPPALPVAVHSYGLDDGCRAALERNSVRVYPRLGWRPFLTVARDAARRGRPGNHPEE